MLKQNRTTRTGGAYLQHTPAGPRLFAVVPQRRHALVKGRLVEKPSDVLMSIDCGDRAWPSKGEPTDNHVVGPRENLAIAYRHPRHR